MQPIPTSLAPFFQEYDLAALDPQTDAHTIIERALHRIAGDLNPRLSTWKPLRG